MGGFLDRPKTEKETESGEGNGLRYGVASMQGWRCEMEDAHHAVIGLPHNLKDWSFFAVFDGHAGAKVSAHCADNLLKTIMANDEFTNYANQIQSAVCDGGGGRSGGGPSSVSSSSASPVVPSASETAATGDVPAPAQLPPPATQAQVDLVKRAMHDGFLNLDEKMKKLPEVESGEDKSGSTAVAALLSPNNIWIANCGDSRAVLSCHGRTLYSTEDHKPVNPQEKDRIQKAGGSVMIQRVNGSLAVSRALGDYEYKQVEGKGPCEQLVSPEPEIHIHERSTDDEFMILACDGVWDVMQNEELCDFVRHQLTITHDLQSICSSIIDTCLHKGSRDNMSVVLVLFPGAPKISEEARLKDEKLNADLTERIQEILKESPNISLYELNRVLMFKFKDDLPPGGGIDAKRHLIAEVHERLSPSRNNSSEPSTPANSSASSIVSAVCDAIESASRRGAAAAAARSSSSPTTTGCLHDPLGLSSLSSSPYTTNATPSNNSSNNNTPTSHVPIAAAGPTCVSPAATLTTTDTPMEISTTTITGTSPNGSDGSSSTPSDDHPMSTSPPSPSPPPPGPPTPPASASDQLQTQEVSN